MWEATDMELDLKRYANMSWEGYLHNELQYLEAGL